MKDPLVKKTKELQDIETEIKKRMQLVIVDAMKELIGSIQGHNDLTAEEISSYAAQRCYEICNAPIGNING